MTHSINRIVAALAVLAMVAIGVIIFPAIDLADPSERFRNLFLVVGMATSVVLVVIATCRNLPEPPAKARFFVVEDYTVFSIWDELLRELPKLPSAPRGYPHPSPLPPGDWTLAHADYLIGTETACARAGFKKPEAEQLPAIVCVRNNGDVQYLLDVRNAEEAAQFIATRI